MKIVLCLGVSLTEVIDVILGTLRFEEANSTGYLKVTSTSRIVHENFSYETLHNDIGMLTIPAITPNEVDPRIMGGTLATQGQFPYQACINIVNFNNSGTTGLCSGMIVSTTRVLTAGHCLFGSEQIDVVLGTLRFEDVNSAGYLRVTSTGRIVHPNFDYSTLKNDIGMLTIPTITYN
ncbi:hypothetical protein B566_EDAN013240, partial [Ephemera danica]